MKRSLVSAAALAAALVVAIPVSAAEISGTIERLSSEEDVIKLVNGPTFYLAEGVSLKGLKPGQTVTITYEMQADIHTATKIAPAK